MEGLSATNMYNENKEQNTKHYYAGTTKNKNPIKIKSKNKGKFTKYCKDKGYKSVTTECIDKGLASTNVTTRKRANFAQNARKWNK